jgi:hypothetical protein
MTNVKNNLQVTNKIEKNIVYLEKLKQLLKPDCNSGICRFQPI